MLGFACASFRRLRLVVWLFTSCVWDALWYRKLLKLAFVSWAKQKLSKTTLSTLQKCLFELWWACCFGCNWKTASGTSSDLSTWNNTCFLFKRRVTFELRWLSEAAFDDGFYVVYLRLTVQSTNFKKKQFFIFWKRGLRRFGLCTFFLKVSVQFFENVGQCHQNQLTFLLKWHWGRPKVFTLSCAWLISLVVNEKCVVRRSRD